MKTVIYEIADWEKALFTQAFPDAILEPEKLNSDTAKLHPDTEVLSCFVYSLADRATLEQFPNLKLIATRSTGYDHIDLNYCKEKGITVVTVPEYGSHTVAEFTFALILELTRKIYKSINQVKDLNFGHEDIRGVDIYGKTLGVIGLGKIGTNVVKIARGFGMSVLVYSRHEDPETAQKYGFNYAGMEDLLGLSDVISLHVPLTPQTKHIINKDNIKWFKKQSFLINTARGGLIDTEALIIALEEGILAGVGLDAIEEEKELTNEVSVLRDGKQSSEELKTMLYDHLLFDHPKVIITPHNAFNTQEAMERIAQTTIENIQSYLEGNIQNNIQ